MTDYRHATLGLALVGVLFLGACQTAAPADAPLTDAERAAIVETMTRVASAVLVDDGPACVAGVDQHFSGREPVLTWSVASDGQAGIYSFRTKEELKPPCGDTVTPAHFDLEQADAHVLSRDYAYIVLTGIYTREPVGGPPQRSRVVATNIFERIGDDWKLARQHASLIGEKSQR